MTMSADGRWWWGEALRMLEGPGSFASPAFALSLSLDRSVYQEAGNKTDDPGDGVVRPLLEALRP